MLYFWHSVGNRVLTLLSNMFTNLNLTDMETCYKVFRREIIQRITIEEDRFGFEPEITAKVAALGLPRVRGRDLLRRPHLRRRQEDRLARRRASDVLRGRLLGAGRACATEASGPRHRPSHARPPVMTTPASIRARDDTAEPGTRWASIGHAVRTAIPTIGAIGLLVALAVHRYLPLVNADALVPALISTQHLTFFYWGQDRLASLVPALAWPVRDSIWNFRVQMLIAGFVFFGLLAMFVLGSTCTQPGNA